MTPEPFAVTLQVIDILDGLGIRYVIGGSLAGSMHGLTRSTIDSDLVADIRTDHVPAFVAALGSAFYADAAAITSAIIHGSSFNIIHLRTMFKVDIFPSRRPFDEMQLARRMRQVVSTDPEESAYVLTPEDLVLAKLDWYRLGGESSERQWGDVLSVLRAYLPDRLDRLYLNAWAAHLGVGYLLDRAMREAETRGRDID